MHRMSHAISKKHQKKKMFVLFEIYFDALVQIKTNGMRWTGNNNKATQTLGKNKWVSCLCNTVRRKRQSIVMPAKSLLKFSSVSSDAYIWRKITLFELFLPDSYDIHTAYWRQCVQQNKRDRVSNGLCVVHRSHILDYFGLCRSEKLVQWL